MEGGRRPTVPRWFVPFLQPALWKSAAGGRGAGKSHQFAELAVLRMACSLPWYPQASVRIASARETKVAIKESVKVVIDDKIRAFGLSDEFDSFEFHINSTRTGSHMWFPGFGHDPDALKGVEGADVLWIEQAERIQDEMESIVPTFVRKPGAEFWLSWNPSTRSQWCWRRFMEQPREEDVAAHVTWEDNPYWFPQCEYCLRPYEWGEDGGECRIDDCEGQIKPGLWGLETERKEFELHDPDRYVHVEAGRRRRCRASHCRECGRSSLPARHARLER